MEIKDKLIYLRTSANMSQEQLAKLLNVTRQSISKWEKGDAYPQVDKIIEICKLYRISADDLLDENHDFKKENNSENETNKYFSSEGFRGEVNKSLTADKAYKIGRFLGWYYSGPQFAARHVNNNGRAKIVIGKDTRNSSYMIEYALCSGIVASGADAYILHVTTTQSVSYVARSEGFDCGVMITASHNVFYDNGIKIVNSQGEKLNAKGLAMIESYLDGDLKKLGINADDIPYAIREKIGQVVDYYSGRNRYIAYLISTVSSSFRGYKIGLDCANGSSWMIAKSVFSALGATVFTIGDTPDGTNINKDCGTEHIEKLQQLVIDNKLDCGFAFDGDADRCLAVNEKGEILNGDKLLYILAKRLKRSGIYNNTVICSKVSNSGLINSLEEIGIKVIFSEVGDRNIYNAMIKNDAWLGGEQIGHIIMKKYTTTGDALLVAIKVVEEMIALKQSLSQLTSSMTLYPQQTVSVEVLNKEKVMNDKNIMTRINDINERGRDNARIVIRGSTTESAVRLMVESSSIETCNRYTNELVAAIRKSGYSVN